jgi:predicted alpha/beta-hydrolase family hydrolase
METLMSGEVPILVDKPSGSTVVILAHGAGSHMEHKTIEWLASLVRSDDVSVARFNFLYRVRGKSMPDRMPILVNTYQEVVATLRKELSPDRVIVGGHSMGGRVASMMEAEQGSADGLLLFGYPLHPPGQLDKLRDAHLSNITTPTLQLNGTQDEFCSQHLMDQVVARLDPDVWRLHWIEGADHSYHVKRSTGRSRQDVEVELKQGVAEWIARK